MYEEFPFKLVENNYFRRLFTNVGVRTVMSRQKLTDVINNMTCCVKTVLKKELDDIPYIAITTDGWKSVSNNHYESLTLHYFKDDFTLVNSNISAPSEELPISNTETTTLGTYEASSSVIKGRNAAKNVFNTFLSQYKQELIHLELQNTFDMECTSIDDIKIESKNDVIINKLCVFMSVSNFP